MLIAHTCDLKSVFSLIVQYRFVDIHFWIHVNKDEPLLWPIILFTIVFQIKNFSISRTLAVYEQSKTEELEQVLTGIFRPLL